MNLFTNTIKREPNDLSPCPVTAVVLAGGELHNYVPDPDDDYFDHYEDFVVDLESLIFGDECVIDYNHDVSQIIGSCRNIRVENGKLLADGVLTPFNQGDLANEVSYKSQFVPYGISPTLDFWNSRRDFVEDGETVTINGRSVEGPLAVFRQVRLLGVSICPYPTDPETAINQFKRHKNQKGLKMNKKDEADKDQVVRDKELQHYIGKFGTEKGVRYYQEGLTLEEAVELDYETLKQELEKQSSDNKSNQDPVNKPLDEDKEQKSFRQFCQKQLKQINELIERQSRVINRLIGESVPVGNNYNKNTVGQSYQSAFNKSTRGETND